MQVCRGADRFCTRTGWLTSWHSFSYGQWYDAANVGFGPLVVNNHDVLAPGAGFDDHAHSGVDVVTYVVSGRLEHRDSLGTVAVVGPGEVQLLRSGSGVTHSERNASATEPVEYVQMWVTSDNDTPSYGVPPVGGQPMPDMLVTLGSRSFRRATVGRHQRAGTQAASIHAYVVSGDVTVDGVTLLAGDAVQLVDEDLHLRGTRVPATVLVWRLSGLVAVKPSGEAV